MIAVNQDPLGIPGTLVYSSAGNLNQIWTRPLIHSSYAAVLFNRDESAAQITLTWQMLNEVGREEEDERS